MSSPSPAQATAPASTAIIVIDLQARLLPVIDQGDQVVRQIVKLLRVADSLQVPIVPTEQQPHKLGPTVEALTSLPNWSAPVAKASFSAAPVLGPDLPRTLVLVGIETHVCVRMTALDLAARGHRVMVVGDAVGSREAGNHRLALEELRSSGVRVLSVESLSFEWLGTAEHPQFRTVLGLLK